MPEITAYTDYPIIELGDKPGEKAPIRKVRLLDYDGDKYVTVEVNGVIEQIKSGYIYKRKMRHSLNAPRFTHTFLENNIMVKG